MGGLKLPIPFAAPPFRDSRNQEGSASSAFLDIFEDTWGVLDVGSCEAVKRIEDSLSSVFQRVQVPNVRGLWFQVGRLDSPGIWGPFGGRPVPYRILLSSVFDVSRS